MTREQYQEAMRAIQADERALYQRKADLHSEYVKANAIPAGAHVVVYEVDRNGMDRVECKGHVVAAQASFSGDYFNYTIAVDKKDGTRGGRIKKTYSFNKVEIIEE